MKKLDGRSLVRCWESSIVGVIIFVASVIQAVEGIIEESGGTIGSFDALMDCFTSDVVRWLLFALLGLFSFISSTYKLVQHYRGESADLFEDDDLAVKKFDALTEKPAKPYIFKQGKFSVQFMIPGEYTWNKKEKADVNEDLGMVMFPRFTREDGAIVDCQLHVEPVEDVESGDNIDAEEDVRDHFGYLEDKQRKGVKIRQGVLNGKYIVHYFVTQEKSGFDKMQRLYAACDLDKGKYFTLEMLCDSWEPKLDVKDFSQFFEFEV
ncbi:MAG: hypothetical protein IJP29_05830 [Lachnospiraceae bacterium]|nr:hypothetical protein [Lachnospiraceae bacterium]